MKKFKYMLSVLALALVLTCVMKATPAAAADIAATVDYASLTVEISNATNQVYYQVVKSTSVTTGKVAAWLPATKDDDDYLIDISAFSKGGAILYTTDNTKEAGTVVEIKGTASAVKGTIDFTVEGDDVSSLQAVFATLIVTDDKKADKKYDKSATSASTDLTALNNAYLFQWKRGTNGAWIDAEDDADGFEIAYSMMRTSNSTLYIRAFANNLGDKASLPSKEAKIKVAKTANAPTIKVDYAKGTIAIKTGMELTCTYKTKNVTLYAAQKDASATTTDVLGDAGTKTKKGVSSVTIKQLVDAINAKIEGTDNDITEGESFTIKVRTSATAKKYASWHTELTLVNSVKAPEQSTADGVTAVGTYVYDAYNKKLTLNLTVKKVDGRTLEYAIAGSDADVSTLKFTKVEDTSKPIDLSKNLGKAIKYTTDKAAKNDSLKFEGIGDGSTTPTATVYIRWAAVVDKTTPSKNTFASEVAKIACTKADTATVTIGTNVPGDSTIASVKDAYGNEINSTGVAVTKGSKITVYVAATATTGNEITKVQVKFGDNTKDAEYDTKAKAYVVKDVDITADTTVIVTVTTKSTSTQS